MNLAKIDDNVVDITGAWIGDELLLKLTQGDNVIQFTLDDIDLEHFISTLIMFER